MAKRKPSKKRPQPKHKKQKKSQHDKRKRLERPNPKRKKTTDAKVPLTGAMQTAVSVLQAVMDRRIAFRLAIVIAGMFLADDRRTASAWFVAAGVQDDWDRFYDCLISVGRTSGKLATAVLGLVVQKFAPRLGDRILLGMDDSPTSRYGRHVEGAGVHHNPTAGPADGEWLYGHNWVALAWLATHPLPEHVRYFSLAAFARYEDMQLHQQATYKALEVIHPLNDGQLLFVDQLIPGSALLGYVNADHWTVAVPVDEVFSGRDPDIVTRNKKVRTVLFEAMILFVVERLQQTPGLDNTAAPQTK